MPDRRTFLGFAAALLPFAVEAQTAPAQTSAAPRPELARHALTIVVPA